MKKISIIIPAYNEEKYIIKTIESFYKNEISFELIVICDSCEDKTNEIAKKYTENVFEVNFQNVSKTRNFGFNKSSGDIVVFNDADTIVSNNYLQEIINSINKYDYGCANWVSESDTFWGKYVAVASSNYNKKHIGGNFFIKKELFNSVNGFNEKMIKGEDTDLGDRLRKVNKKHCFLKNCWIIPSERKYKEQGYLRLILKSGFEGFLYKFFRNYYNKTIAKI